ncbi:MAG: choice-of-anchor Q domain-containing protein [Planctomycetota bacterium]
MPANRRIHRLGLVVVFYLVATGCGSHSGDIPATFSEGEGTQLVAGLVSAPAGSVSAPPRGSPMLAPRNAADPSSKAVRCIRSPLVQSKKSKNTGGRFAPSNSALPTVGAGVVVRLVEIDDAGAVVSELARTTTDADGFYAFNLPAGFVHSWKLCIEVLNADGSVAMRSFGSGSVTNVNPGSEAVYQGVLHQAEQGRRSGVGLDSFGTGELGSIESDLSDSLSGTDLSGALADALAAAQSEADQDFFVQADVSDSKATDAPAITGISATKGIPGDLLRLTGNNFGPVAGSAVVRMGGVAVAGFSSWSDTGIEFTVPAAARSGAVIVEREGLASNPVAYEVAGDPLPPVVTRIFPVTGSAGRPLTIAGDGFGEEELTVTFGDIPVRVVPCVCGTEIQLTVPAGVATGPVTVIRPDGRSSNALVYTVSQTFELSRAVVTGRFLDAVSGEPIAGVSVLAVNTSLFTEKDETGDRLAAGAFAPTAVSGADGAFSLDLVTGQYILDVRPDPATGAYPYRNFQIDVPEGYSTVTVGDVSLAGGFAIGGQLRDSFGAVVAGARVLALAIPPATGDVGGEAMDRESGLGYGEGETGADGNFRMALYDGNYRFRVEPMSESGIPPQEFVERVDGAATLAFMMKRGVVISGRVTVEGSGAPVPQAAVVARTVGSELASETYTGVDGSYQVPVFPGEQNVLVRCTMGVVEATGTVDADTTLDIVMPAGAVISGTLVDTAGAPVAGVEVRALQADLSNENLADALKTAISDEAGLFRMTLAVKNGATPFFLSLSDRILGATRFPDQRISMNGLEVNGSLVVHGDEDIGQIVVRRGVVVSGRVLNAPAAPVIVTAVQTDSLLPFRATAQTDASGNYQLQLMEGIYNLEFAPPAGSGLRMGRMLGVVVMGSNLSGKNVILPGSVMVTGKTTAPNGTVLAAEILAVGDSSLKRGYCVSDAATGQFSMVLPEGTYDFYLYPVTSGYVTVGYAGRGVAAPTLSLGTTAFPYGRVLSGRILVDADNNSVPDDADGNGTADGVGGVNVVVYEDTGGGIPGGWVGSGVSDTNGNYRVSLSDGSYVAYVLIPPGVPGLENLVPPAPSLVTVSGGAVALSPVLNGQSGTLSGLLTDPDGQPVSGADVTVAADLDSGAGVTRGGAVAWARTGADGSYSINLLAGQYVVDFIPPAGSNLQDSTDHAVTVGAGVTTLNGTFTVIPQTYALVFRLAPGNTRKTLELTPAVEVAVVDGAGNTVTAATGTMTLAIGSNPAGGVLSGTASAALTNGVASFPGISINNAGIGYTLVAMLAGIGSVESDSFNILDAAGITVSPVSGLVTTEAGGTASFIVALNGVPLDTVTIVISSGDITEGAVSPASLVFTAGNWSTPQTVTVIGVDDLAADGNVAYSIITAAAVSNDATYGGIDSADVTVTNNDNDSAGITVTPTSGLVTTEAGGTANFSIVLNSQPTANVVIGISSDDVPEGTVSPASLTFTSANWNTPQTVTATGADDAVADGNVAYTVITAAASSSDATYNGINPADVSVTNNDNDTAGVTVTPTSGLVTTESAATDGFTVVLDSQPTANVVINLSSSDVSEGAVSPASLTFTSANWNTPQAVTVTGADDAVADGNVAYSIVTAPAVSADGNYSGMDPFDVSATNNDNDTAGITVTPTSGLVTTEAGGTANFTVVLDSQPTANVAIGLSSSNVAEGTVSPASLTFTGGDWNTPQTVTVTGVDDLVQDGNTAYNIITAAATSADGVYNGMNASNVALTNNDNDVAGITVTPTSGLVTTEAGGTDTFTVVLDSQPTANVGINLTSSDLPEGTVSPASLTFTTANWNTPQTVTVTGVNDDLDDGDVGFAIVTAAATSADPVFNTMPVADVSVTNTDNDTAAVTVNPTAGLVTTEVGGWDQFTVILTSEPTADVTINLTSSDLTEGTVSPASLTFTAGDWGTSQVVTVTGADDAGVDGAVAYSVVTAASSADGLYNGIAVADVSASNTDNDTAGITVTPVAGLSTTEAGTTDGFTVVLDSQPTANVVIGLSSSDVSEGTVSPASLTFTSANWNTPQAVTVTGVDDGVDDGDVGYTVITAAAASADPVYNAMAVSDVSVTNTDDDTAGATVNPVSGLVTTEAGGTDTFDVVLDCQPTADVSIALTSSDLMEGTVSPPSLLFTSANWSTPQTVTVTGVNDAVDDGDIGFTIVTAAATSADPAYNALAVADVSVTNTDDDAAGITVNPTSGIVTTEAGGTDTFDVVLDSQPTANVVIGISSDDVSEGTVNPASLTFTSANWNTPQTVTVTGADDAADDGDMAYSILVDAATSADPAYNGQNPSDVTASNTDNDTAGITVNPTSGLVTSEAGGTAQFNVVLASQPSDDVTMDVASSNVAEGTVSAATLTFTNANWSTPQTVTVTGQNDVAADGPINYTIIINNVASTDLAYSGLDPADVSVTNTDDDTPGITVNPTAGLTTTEAGGTAQFNVVLNTLPTDTVDIGISSSDLSEGTVLPATLTFTVGNWNTPQTVTITGANDAVADGNVGYTILTAAASSTDLDYNNLDAADVSVSNTDNDTAGITVTPTSGLVTTEAGVTDQFSIVLTSEPTASVTINLSSSDLAEGSVLPASVTFTNLDWSTPQNVTVTGVDDGLDDGDVGYSIITDAASSGDGTYNGMNPANVTVTNTDNDTAGVTVNPTSGLVTTEAGGTDTFDVVLDCEPTANVVINLSSTDTSEGTVLPASLTFTAGDWSTPQTVTVTGADDAGVDGNVGFTILTSAAASADPTYNGKTVSDVTATNNDDDVAGITVNPTSGLVTTEAGSAQNFTIVLDSQPTADVTIGLSSSDTSEGTVAPPSFTFTSANWSTPQQATVTGVNDFIDDGNVGYSIITAAATSTDPAYGGMTVGDVSLTNNDDDVPGITVNPTSGLVTTEEGGTVQFTVVLDCQPAANVIVGISSGDTTEGWVAPTSLTFTSANWSTSQTVTVTGLDDAAADGVIAYSVVTAAATSADPSFNGINPSDVSLSNGDNEGSIVWTGAGVTNNWSESANWAGNIVPGALNKAVFNNTSSKSATINVATSVKGIEIQVGYGGTVTQAAGQTFTVGTDGFSQAAGTFTGGNSAITVNGAMVVTDGLFTTTSATLQANTLVITNPGVVRMAANGKLALMGSGTPLTGTGTLDTTTNTPNTVEYTGVGAMDIAAAGPATAYHHLSVTPPGFSRSESYSLVLGECLLRGAVIDMANGYAYFGTYTTPAYVVKIDLVTFTRVGVITLNSGESWVSSGVIDPVNGKAYFGTGGSPGVIVKVDLATFTRVGAITLNAGEDSPKSAVIDTANGYAYFGTLTSPARIVKVDLSTFTRMGAITLNTGENNLNSNSAVIDASNGYAYFGTGSSPAKVVKLNLNTFTRVGAITLDTGENTVEAAVIDTVNGYAYFGTWTNPGKVVKVDLSTFARVGAITLDTGENYFASAVIDATNGYAYFGTGNVSSNKVVKVNLGTFTRVGALTLNTWESNLHSAVIDTVNGFAYFGTNQFPGCVIKVDLATFSRINAITCNVGDDDIGSAVIDPANGYAYFGGGSAPGRVVKMDLTTFARVGALTLNAGENNLDAATIDTVNGYAYFGTNTSPGIVVKVDLSTFTRVAAITLDVGENYLQSAVIDSVNGYAYFGTGTLPGRVVKVDLSTFTRVGSIALNAGEDSLKSAVVDVTNGYAYFGTNPSPGQVVKVDLSTFARVGAITLNTGENSLQSAVIDVANEYAYFGTETSPGKVVKINLSTFMRVGVVTLNAGESNLRSAVVDAANGYAYFGTCDSSGEVVKLNLYSFTRVGVLAANAGENPLESAVIDSANGYAYFGTKTYPSHIVKVNLTPRLIRLGTVNAQTLTVNGDLTLGDGTNSCSVDDLTYFPTVNVAGNLLIKSGATLNQGVGSVTAGTVTVNAGGAWQNLSVGDVAIGAGGVTNNGVIAFNGGGAGCGADDIVITSTSSPTQRTWTGTGTFSMRDVNVTDQVASGVAITAVHSTGTGQNNSGWTFTGTCDGPTIIVTPTSGLVTTEAGGTAQFTVVLSDPPSANVSIPISSNDPSEGTVSTAMLVFTPANWYTPQTVTVTGVDDPSIDGNVPYTVLTGVATSADANYDLLDAPNVSVTTNDNDTAGVTVNPTSGLTTTEPGGTAQFTVVLTSMPTASVQINITSSDSSEGTPDTGSLMFTSATWNTPQTVTVTGTDDAMDDGDVGYSIIVGACSSGDGNYNGFNPSDVSLTNTDNDTAGITVSETSGLVTGEPNATDNFTITLTSQPTANVVVDLSSSDTSEGTINPVTLTFTSANWNVPQTVWIYGQDDAVDDGNVGYTIITAAAVSGDPVYNNMNPSDVSVTNTDDDTAGITVNPMSGLTTTEAGGANQFTVVLTSQPTANVTITLTSSDTTEGLASPTSLTFTPANWASIQQVVVTGVDDDADDGNVGYSITTLPASSADGVYDTMDASDVSLTNTDNEDVVYVKFDAGGANNGTSWVNAYTSLATALTNAVAGQQLWVAAGTYKPGGSRTNTFQMKASLPMYGGFAGGESARSARNWVTNQTILNGDVNGDDAGLTNNTENNYHVVTGAGPAILDGFVIRGGNANSTGVDSRGGGLTSSTTLTVQNCVFTENFATDAGAGAYFVGNPAAVRGSLFLNNVSGAGSGGAGLSFDSTTSADVADCVFAANTSAGSGGGARIMNAVNGAFTNCVFTGNTATSGNGGGFISAGGSTAEVSNCTFQGNSANYGGGACAMSSVLKVMNCVMWGDTMITAGPEIHNGTGTVVIANTDISGNVAGVNGGATDDGGNLNVDPQFTNVGDKDGADNRFGTPDDGLALGNASPALDVGIYLDPLTYDVASQERVRGGGVDMGAYENQTGNIVYVDKDATGSNNGSSWANAYVTLASALGTAAAGDEIWVADGIYKPAAGSRSNTLQLVSRVGVYGGFTGTETYRIDRDWRMRPTVLSGDFNGDDSGFTNNTENAYNVVTGANKAILDGFVIREGNGPGGSGLSNNSSSPSVRNCTFSMNNGGPSAGGAVMNNNSSPSLFNCIFRDNIAQGATANGGGVCNTGASSRPKIVNSVFLNNYSEIWGGGIAFSDSASGIVVNCTFKGNTAVNCGGAVYMASSSVCRVVNCVLWGDTSASGNEVYVSSATLNIGSTDISGGLAGITGGGTVNDNGGNISSDPYFETPGDPDGADNIWATDDDGLMLQVTSGAKNTGTWQDAPRTDIRGVTRPQGGTQPDMGAYEQ